jgi:thioredoxin-like negative regulator of GroEL
LEEFNLFQIRLNKQNEAIQSVRKALLDPQDQQLKLQEAYLLNQQNRNTEALVIFKNLAHPLTVKSQLKHNKQFRI